MSSTALDTPSLTPEEILGPPKVDGIGFLLILMVAVAAGFIIGVVVFLLAYLFLGNFTIQSGVSPILLAMIAFFATLFGNMVYLWGLTNIFPHIYHRTKTIYLQVSVFSIVLYIFMSIVYILVNTTFPDARATLTVYVAHIVMNIFGLILLVGVLSLYRYSILVFYSSILGLVITTLVPMYAFTMLSSSTSTLFVFMVFSSLAFTLMTGIVFGIQAIYYKVYTLSGSDPLGNVLDTIAHDEESREQTVQKNLFQ